MFWPPHNLPLWKRNGTWFADHLEAAGFLELEDKHQEYLLEVFAISWGNYLRMWYVATNTTVL